MAVLHPTQGSTSNFTLCSLAFLVHMFDRSINEWILLEIFKVFGTFLKKKINKNTAKQIVRIKL